MIKCVLDKVCGDKVCVEKVFVDKVYGDKVWRRAEEEKAAEEEPGIQNQKQEPHTKMWGKKPHLDIRPSTTGPNYIFSSYPHGIQYI